MATASTRLKGGHIISPERQAAIAVMGDLAPLTIDEAAALSGRAHATINRWVSKGLLRRTKVAGSSFYLLGDLKATLSGATSAVGEYA